MNSIKSILVIALLLATTSNITDASERDRKQMQATRIVDGSLKIDGRLDDQNWKQAEFVTDFKQKEPVENGVPSDKTEVAILYDNEFLYVGARLFSDHANELRQFLNKRDTQAPTEQFIVTLDTYFDRRTSYGFGVSVPGVRFERYHSTDAEHPRDFSFNPVWEARTVTDDSGWTVEMAIPFSQLRFHDIEKQTWGINFNRWIPRVFEDVFWVVVPRDESGWASHFGNLTGIENIKPSRRLELLPYVATEGSSTDNFDEGDPFNDRYSGNVRVGGDLKMGLGPNLTLEATFNPDFGQVEADAAQVNLSQYETFFPEKRPFFTEGSQLFQVNGPNFFYSRRIGASPHVYLDGEFTDQPSNTSIIGAAKLTGRLNQKTSIGFLTAITSREYGHIFSSNVTTKHEVEPLASYNVFRLQRELGNNGSTAGLILTGAMRNFDKGSNIAAVLNKRAFSGGFDWNWRFAGGAYEFTGLAGFSHVEGSAGKISDLQNSSARYFNRPDADHVEFDETRISLTGYTGTLRFQKREGKHWLYFAGVSTESPEFELNDLGILYGGDDIDSWAGLVYRETTPSSWYRNWRVELETYRSWNYGSTWTGQNIELDGSIMWKNLWNSSFDISHDFAAMSDSRTRGGPLMATEDVWEIGASTNSSFQEKFSYGLNATYAWDDLDGWFYSVRGNMTLRAGDKIEFSFFPQFQQLDLPRQFVTTIYEGGPTSTFGNRYVFANIEQTEIRAQVRLNYFFTPDLSLEIYAEPFVSSGQYTNYGELAAAGTNDLRVYGTDGTTIIDSTQIKAHFITDGADSFELLYDDFSNLSFRSSIVLRYEFLPGSTAYLVWQRNLEDSFGYNRYSVRPGDLFNTFSGDGTDFLAFKISYWIPIS